MPTMLDIRSLLRSRREERTSDVFSMARQLARNESVDRDELFAAMTVAGMNDAALADLVELIDRRTTYRAKASTLAAAEKELASVRDAIKRQREALDEAEKRYRRAVEPLLHQEEVAASRVSEATSAASALAAPANLPAEINGRVEAARKSLLDAGVEVRKIENEISLQERRVEDGLAVVDREGGFDKCAKYYDDPARRQAMRFAVQEAVENVRGGRHRLPEINGRLAKAIAARDAAQVAYAAAEKAARDF
jgi:hypothetical protein